MPQVVFDTDTFKRRVVTKAEVDAATALWEMERCIAAINRGHRTGRESDKALSRNRR